MTVWEIYQFIEFRANKDQSGRSYTPEQFNLACKAVNIEYFKLKAGLPEEYRVGAPMPRQAWQLTQKITDDLRMFMHVMGIDGPQLQINRYGLATLPANYVRESSIMYDNASTVNCESVEGWTAVEVVTDAVWSDRLASSLKYPDKEYPICRFIGGRIEFAPKDLKYVSMTYLRMPEAAVLGYTIDSNNDIVYNAATSTQFEWPEDTHTDIANWLVSWLAENLNTPMLIQQAERRKMQGQ